jgi:predicted dehydrogenase
MIRRVLIAGHGSIGKRHLRIVREALPTADICVLRHLPCKEIPEYANACLSTLEEACAFEPQVSIIASPAPFHLETALALAATGSHLLIEKPLSTAVTGVQALMQCARKKDLTIQVGYNLRFLSSLEEYRQMIHAGIIGRVLSVRCEIGQYLPSWRPDADYRRCVSARKDLGGGVLLELSHEMDYLRWIFGEVSWVNAWSDRQSSLEVDVEDCAHLLLGFETDSSSRILVVTLNLDFIRHDTIRLCTAIGEKGSLRWNGVTGELELWPTDSKGWQLFSQYDHQRDDSYRAQWRGFLNCVQNKQLPRVSVCDGLAVLEIIDAAQASATIGGGRVSIVKAERMLESWMP